MTETLPARPRSRQNLHLSRRLFLFSSVAASALTPALAEMAAADVFSFDALTEAARQAAAQDFSPPARLTGAIADLSYDDYRLIQFRADRARWAVGDGPWHLHAFHLGWLFDAPVAVYDVTDGTVVSLDFSDLDFDYRGDMAAAFPPDTALPGIAGFRLNGPLNTPDRFDEIVSFLGASYFRALGAGNAYGISARGLAINTATITPEEFPKFTAFYLARDPAGGPDLTVHALLDTASVSGAFQFVLRPGQVTEMDVTARLFFRAAVEEVGIAPLTSMFLFSGTNRAGFDDYRPRVHDSDGLRITRADGDVVWRPLNNPARLASAYFLETSPARFGLHQRNRDFAAYQDANARYDLRPSLEVVPQGDWGRGFVRLVEIPTDMEIHDNIVAFFVPEDPISAGDAREFSYLLRWGDLSADADDLGQVVATSAGHGGTSGTEIDSDTRKFVVDFRGAALDGGGVFRPVVTVNGADVLFYSLDHVPDAAMWRLVIDIRAERSAVVELTAHLATPERKVSEIWVAQWVVPDA